MPQLQKRSRQEVYHLVPLNDAIILDGFTEMTANGRITVLKQYKEGYFEHISNKCDYVHNILKS